MSQSDQAPDERGADREIRVAIERAPQIDRIGADVGRSQRGRVRLLDGLSLERGSAYWQVGWDWRANQRRHRVRPARSSSARSREDPDETDRLGDALERNLSGVLQRQAGAGQ